MDSILTSLSNREIAVFSWLAFFFLLMLLSKDLRRSMTDVIEALFNRHILPAMLLLFFYIALCTLGLYKAGFWHEYLIKDTILWTITVGLALFFNINDIDKFKYFGDLLKANIKWNIILEFVINFYNFSLVTEFIIQPIIGFIFIAKAVADAHVKHNTQYTFTSELFGKLVAYIGIGFGLFVLYKTITQYTSLVSIANLESLLLPLIYTVLVIPFIYLLALYVQYELLLVRVKLMTNNDELKVQLRNHIFASAKLNLNKVVAISKGLKKADVYHNNNLAEYFQKLIVAPEATGVGGVH